jgi:U3 small nucleolar RNA-associated protein 6
MEYHSEKFIDQYQHIRQLELLTGDELSALKNKRNQFEVKCKSSTDVKPYIEYIKYEVALMKKFKQAQYENANDGKALDKSLALHIKEIYRIALKRFPDKKSLWENYIEYAKQKFPNHVTSINQEMLNFHHNQEDYIDAIMHEIGKKNYNVAINFITQGMNRQKDSKELVILYIECSLKVTETADDDDLKASTLLQVTRFYQKFLKGSREVRIHVDLLNKLEKFQFAMRFQNEIITNVIRMFQNRPEVWDLLARRHLNGIFYEPSNEKNLTPPEEIPMETRVNHALAIYEKGFELVDDPNRKQMYTFCINKLIELDGTVTDKNCIKMIRQELGKRLSDGCKERKLSLEHFLYCLELRICHQKKYQQEIEDMLQVGSTLFPNSMEFYEVAIKYYFLQKSFENVTKLFQFALSNNEKSAVDLYKFLCGLYAIDDDFKQIKRAMLEAVKSSNNKLSAAFQEYIIEYYAVTCGIEQARKEFNELLKSSEIVSLSMEFFKKMIELEEMEVEPDDRNISNCYQRAVARFGQDDPQVSNLIWREILKKN